MDRLMESLVWYSESAKARARLGTNTGVRHRYKHRTYRSESNNSGEKCLGAQGAKNEMGHREKGIELTVSTYFSGEG